MKSRAIPGRIGLILFVVIALLPITFSIGYALLYSVGLVGLLREGFTWTHWSALFEGSEVLYSFGLSIYISLAVVVATVLLSLWLTLQLRRSLLQGPLSYALYAPLAIPATVAAFFVFQLFSGSGLLSRLLFSLGVIDTIQEFPGLINDSSGIGIILAHVGLAIPFFVILFHEIYSSEGVDKLTQLARTLGASRQQVIWRIQLPILIRKAFLNIALLFIVVLGSYEIPLLLGRQNPQMISVLTMRKYEMFDIREKPEAFIVALLYTLLVITILSTIFWRRANQREA